MEYFVAFWVVCSVVTYGYSFGYFQRRFSTIAKMHYWQDMAFCMIMSFLGPLSLTGFAIALQKKGFRYGLKFW